jgi:hypothetical protein
MRCSVLACMLAGSALVLAVPAQANIVLFDTGEARPVLFDSAGQGNHVSTYVGWGSGNLAPGQEQRWSAQAFSLPAGNWDLTQIDANYFLLDANVPPERIGIRIWSRSGQTAAAPSGEVFIGDVAAPALVADPRIPGSPQWLGVLDLSGLSISLGGGDYYLSIFGMRSTGSGGGIGWLANPEHGINLVDPTGGDAFMWRSVQYPSPGFATYTLGSNILMQSPGMDPLDRYNAAFTIHGIPSPGALALLILGGAVGLRRRR